MNFSKRATHKKQKNLRSSSVKLYSKFKFWTLRICIVSVIGIFIIGIYAGWGLLKGILDNSPSVDRTQIQPVNFASTIYDGEGNEVYKLVGSDANRISVSLEQMPEHLKNAFIAIEDERFYSHNGIDLRGIARAASSAFSSGSLDQGASTITQQLIKNVVFSGGNESTTLHKVQRKIQEQYLALHLETEVDKDFILENYLNTINLGQNTLGVQAAALRYFDKEVSDLTLSECAVIASITKNPSNLNPITYPENNAARRKNVLDKMLSLSMISNKEYKEALKDSVYKRIKKINKKKTKTDDTVTSYFTDAVIDAVQTDLQEKLGYTESQATNLLYRGGLSIYTTQDATMQKICDTVISDPAYYPIGTSYSLSYRLSITDSKGKMHNYDENSLKSYITKSNPSFQLRVTDQNYMKTYIKAYRKAMKKKWKGSVAGESIQFTMQPQISFVLMDPATGQVKALVGGRGKKNASRTLNRATSSVRQPGSTFKVLSAYLPALDAAGMTLATVYDDAPYNYPGTNRPVRNWYSSGYKGLTTLRSAIRDSMNIVTVKTLEDVTPQTAYLYLEDLGFTSLVGDTSQAANDINLSMALGGLTYGVTNFEATAAYASIANGGTYQEPILYTKVVDHEGNVLLENTSESRQVMKEATAFLLTDAMRDVVTTGTGTLANFTSSSMPVAGKTGTTTNNVDAWFIGYTPYYCAGIWTGYDDNTPLSTTSYHKVIWRSIMEQIHQSLKVKEFNKPASIVTATVCSKSGKLAKPGICQHAPGGSTVYKEYFAGSAPTEYCDAHVCVKICSASGQKAGASCPASGVYNKIVLQKTETGTTSDTPYCISSSRLQSTCSVHNGTSAATSTKSPESPAHSGEEKKPENSESTENTKNTENIE